MKQTLLSFAAAMCTLTAVATSYTGTLTVAVNGEATSQDSVNINVTQQADGTYDLALNDFTLQSGASSIPVGNISLKGMQPATTPSGVTVLTYNDTTAITEGSTGGSTWIGPYLGAVPLRLVARFNATGQMVTSIDIDMTSTLNKVIEVKFDAVGDTYQLPNAGFEDYVASSGEPLHWHGFKSAKGSFASFASSTLAASTDVRPGSTGSKSAVVGSTKIFGVVANGTMTTGQLNAGAMSASNTANHSEMDMSSTATDNNGDPYYVALQAKPDTVKVWLKFKQGTANATYPYATFNAVVTDGTYYQDPEDKTYTNVAAKASNSQIAEGDWKEYSIPFDYASYSDNNAAAKGVLITVSTNATPGQGSSGDQVWTDDISLVYNANVAGLSYKNAPIDGFSPDSADYSLTLASADEIPSDSDFVASVQGAGAETATLITPTANGYDAVVTVLSGDLLTAHSYVVHLAKPVLTGDLNADGMVDVKDVNMMVNHILGLATVEGADLNADGTVDTNDVTELINLILQQ